MYAATQYIEYSLVMKHNCRRHCCCNLIHRKWQERTCAQFNTRNAILFIPLKLLEVHANKISEFHFCLVTGLCALWKSAVCIVCWKCRFLKGLKYRVFILIYNYRLPLPAYRINITHSTERLPAPRSSNGKPQLPDKITLRFTCRTQFYLFYMYLFPHTHTNSFRSS